MSDDIKETYEEEENKVDVEKTSINLDCVKKEPNEDVLDFNENSAVNQYRITLKNENVLIGTSGFKFEENGDNLIGFVDNDVIMENTIIKLEYVKDECLNHFHCSKCNGNYKGYCLKCSTLTCILNNNIPLVNSNSELNHIPTDILEVRETSMGKGVFLLTTLPKDVKFGPFEGISGIKSTDGCSWKINDKKLLSNVHGNWMKDVSSENVSFKNLDIFQIDESLYFQTNREIIEGEELFIYYADQEIQKLENSKECLYTPQKQEKLSKIFACTLCCLGFGSDKCLMEHKKKCSRLEQSRSIKDFKLIECHYCKMWMEKWEHEEYHVAYCLEKYHRMWYVYSEADDRASVGRMEDYLSTEDANREYKRDVSSKPYCLGYDLGITEKDHSYCRVEKESSLKNDSSAKPINNELEQNEIETKYKCSECPYRTDYKGHLKEHTINVQRGIKLFQCNTCLQKFAMKISLTLHIKNKHMGYGEKDYKCSESSYETNYKSYFKVHVNNHNGVKPFTCYICMMKFSRKRELKIHTKNKHTECSEKDCKCPECVYQTNNKSYFQTHLNAHNGIKPFQCVICLMEFTVTHHLKSHIKSRHTETGGKDYKCSECPFQTSYKNSLKLLLNTHNDVKPFQCDIFKIEFCHKAYLETHTKNVHTGSGEQDYICLKCSFQTNYRHSYQYHLNAHNGVKPYQCDFCMRKFTVKHTLLRHVKYKHTEIGEKEYKCSVCSFQTSYKNSLKLHLNMHNVKPFQCDICKIKFSEKCYLTNHPYYKHTESVEKDYTFLKSFFPPNSK